MNSLIFALLDCTIGEKQTVSLLFLLISYCTLFGTMFFFVLSFLIRDLIEDCDWLCNQLLMTRSDFFSVLSFQTESQSI